MSNLPNHPPSHRALALGRDFQDLEHETQARFGDPDPADGPGLAPVALALGRRAVALIGSSLAAGCLQLADLVEVEHAKLEAIERQNKILERQVLATGEVAKALVRIGGIQ